MGPATWGEVANFPCIAGPQELGKAPESEAALRPARRLGGRGRVAWVNSRLSKKARQPLPRTSYFVTQKKGSPRKIFASMFLHPTAPPREQACCTQRSYILFTVSLVSFLLGRTYPTTTNIVLAHTLHTHHHSITPIPTPHPPHPTLKPTGFIVRLPASPFPPLPAPYPTPLPPCPPAPLHPCTYSTTH